MKPDPERDKGKIIVCPDMLRGMAGWLVWEDPQICPFFLVRRHAIDYAITRGDGRRPLEVWDESGNVLRAIDGPGLKELAHRAALGILAEEKKT